MTPKEWSEHEELVLRVVWRHDMTSDNPYSCFVLGKTGCGITKQHAIEDLESKLMKLETI